jgi:hypothetical protein
MIIVRHLNNKNQYYSASRKSLPGLVSEINKDGKLEDTIAECQYCEFSTGAQKTGELKDWRLLKELVSVKVSLALDPKEEEENAE